VFGLETQLRGDGSFLGIRCEYVALSRRLRIAQITSACHPRGGIQRVVYELSKRLARDHDVHIFAGSCELQAEGVTFHKLPVVPWPWVVKHLGYFLTTRWALLREQARAPFDIVHVQGIPSAVESDVTTAHSVHCVGTNAQKEHMPRGERIARYVKTMEPLMMWLTSYNFYPDRCKRVIAISEHVKRDVVNTFGMAPENVDVTHNGVDVEAFFVRSKLGLQADQVTALFVAHDFKWRGLGVLIKALARLAPEERPYLIVVGYGRDPLLSLVECKRLCAESGVAQWIRFVGAVENVEDYLAAGDFFVLPTVYEAFGIAILEALASGLPVIFSRLAGATDIVADGREALLIEDPTDPCEVAAGIRVLADSAPLRARMGAAARETALNYSWDLVTQRTLNCYETLLSRRASEKAESSTASVTGSRARITPGGRAHV